MHHPRLFLISTLVHCSVFLVGFPALADTPTQATEPISGPKLEVSPIVGTIEVDGDLSDSGWRNVARATGFVEVGPGDNTVPAVPSAAMITYDQSHLYVALIAWDDPTQVRASMCDRDAIFRDDHFGLLLDTYGDYAWAYEIFVNPLGMQGDRRLLGDGSEDPSLDLVFESEGMVTDSGYQAELAIPFASLRFPDKPEQTWRLTFWRDRQRENRYRYSWAPLDRDNACFFCPWGTLTGIRNVKPSSNFDILPNVITHQSGAMGSSSIPDSHFDSSDPEAELSINARYGLSTSSSVEVTVNPDFSQVESDAGQIDVNETFALYYPERRPFFQEGSDLYGSFFNIIHTRTINDPIVAGKFTGQFGNYSFAYMAARDQHSPLVVPLRESSCALALESSTENILRARRTFGQDSYVGVIVTDRRTDSDTRVDTLYPPIDDTLYERMIDTVNYSSGSGTTYGVDSRIRLNRNLSLELMGLGSHTREPRGDGLIRTDGTFDYGGRTIALDGESFDGHALHAGFNWGGRCWDWVLSYQELSPTFRADNGWMTANDRRQLNYWTGLVFQPNRSWLIEWGPQMNLGRVFSHRARVNLDPGTFDPGILDEWWRPGIYLNLKGQTSLTLEYMASREWYLGQLFTGISRGFVNLNARPSGAVDLQAYFEYGHKVVRFLPRKGILTNLSLYGGFKPTQRVRIDQEFDYQSMKNRDNYMEAHPDSDRTIYSVSIFRTRFSYQFTREWFLRLIVEYGDNNNTQDPNYLSVEPLLTYRINPFTMFYIGASWGGRHFKDGYVFERETELGDGTVRALPADWNKPTWRLERAQVYAKFQYLFRL